MLTPIIIPLGTVQVPLQSQEPNPAYHQYQVHTQYQVPDMQQLPLSDPRGLNHIPPGVLPPELRNIPQVTMEMRPPRMGPQTPMMGPQAPAMGPQVSVNNYEQSQKDKKKKCHCNNSHYIEINKVLQSSIRNISSKYFN